MVGCSPWGHTESDTTERLRFHVSLSCTGEGNGNPFQCSCLEKPRDGGACWAAVYGVAQSWTRLKRQQQQQQLAYYLCKCLINASKKLLLFGFIVLSHQNYSILDVDYHKNHFFQHIYFKQYVIMFHMWLFNNAISIQIFLRFWNCLQIPLLYLLNFVSPQQPPCSCKIHFTDFAYTSLAHLHLSLIQQTDGICEIVLDKTVHVIFAHLILFSLSLRDSNSLPNFSKIFCLFLNQMFLTITLCFLLPLAFMSMVFTLYICTCLYCAW